MTHNQGQLPRRLTAIMQADVVGYSRLMGADESGTLSRLNAHRGELIDPTIKTYQGRVVKLMGDGALVEFPSIVDAVACAVAIQEGMVKRNQGTPKSQRIEFRIGINLADVIVKDDDIYGDGVNVTARLEALAEPGGVCLSDTVYKSVRGKLDLVFQDLGEQQVKNIAEPIRAYQARLKPGSILHKPAIQSDPDQPIPPRRRGLILAVASVLIIAIGATLIWLQPWSTQEEPASVGRMTFPLPDKPSIAVLPFTNMSGDPEQEYFSDGITEDLTTDLSKISGLFVIARNSAFSYKGQQIKVQQVAEELGVRYVLEGSVRRAGDQVRINAQLIDATTGGHLWAERYDYGLIDIFSLQDSKGPRQNKFTELARRFGCDVLIYFWGETAGVAGLRRGIRD